MILIYIITFVFFAYLIYKGRNIVNKTINYKLNKITYYNNRIKILNGLNSFRETNLIADKEADLKADNRCNEIIEEYKETSKISHKGFSDGCSALIKIGAKNVGENIAFGYSSVKGVLSAWKFSESHFKNIKNENFNAIGISIKKYNNRYFYVTIFMECNPQKL